MKSQAILTNRTLLTQTLLILCVSFGCATDRTTVPNVQPLSFSGIDKFSRVSETLYRGAQPTPEGFAALEKMGIKTVVSLRAFHSDKQMLEGTGMQYVEIPCYAWSPQDIDIEAFLRIVRDPCNQPVFVHCAQGVDRTGMMVAAYRITEQGWASSDAVREMDDFGFHPIWAGIKQHIVGLNIDSMKPQIQPGRTVVSAGID